MTRRSAQPAPVQTADITGLTHEGLGVAKVDGKAQFVDGALPGERVNFRVVKKHRNYDEAELVEVLRASPQRVAPQCAHFGVCGGCVLQHLAPEAQVEFKQQLLLDNLKHIGGVVPRKLLPPLRGPSWGYRRKARLSVKYVEKKAKVLVGFHERRSPFIADLQRCAVLHPEVGERLEALAALVEKMSIRSKLPQIEIAVGDTGKVILWRHMEPFAEADIDLLKAFSAQTGFDISLQAGGPNELVALTGGELPLRYELPEYALSYRYEVNDFTQINHDINRRMVAQALSLLAPSTDDRVLDLFCGLGNFTLPLARRVREVVGVEGDAKAISRARANAQFNQIANAVFHVQNLASDFAGAPWLQGGYDAILLDPPRSGAIEALGPLKRLAARRIVYVSCNPSTLARDAKVLVEDHGYRLESAGIMDMFPHTAHVESMALFVRKS